MAINDHDPGDAFPPGNVWEKLHVLTLEIVRRHTQSFLAATCNLCCPEEGKEGGMFKHSEKFGQLDILDRIFSIFRTVYLLQHVTAYILTIYVVNHEKTNIALA